MQLNKPALSKVLNPYSLLCEKRMPEWVVPKAPTVWNMQKKTAELKECIVQTNNEQDGVKRRGSTNESNGKSPCVQKRTSNQPMRSTVNDFSKAHE